ncbi:PTS sugar transporter subunit IIB [Erysipelothrix urinaevulpis]|uniref:PTS sugar transporter subunit IIB n=1 Tax=Erysipelothrix urinaevulpis TaxID=2683717 RepID=UPI001359FEB3|nr:PTS sugar transporter subunit IIB [Erysipelothrix urinaevulpis]
MADLRVLFVCSQGMSSEIAVNALKDEGAKNGIEIEVKAVSTQEFEDEIKNDWNCALVAPQIRHRFKVLKPMAETINVPCEMIEPMAYTPLGGPKLLKQVQDLTK